MLASYKNFHPQLNHVVTNTDLIFVTELQVPDNLDKDIQDFDCLTLANTVTDLSVGFVNELYRLCLEEFSKLDENFICRERIRILLNKLPKKHKPAEGIHRDSDSITHWSFLIHLKGDSGSTVFYDNLINPKQIKEVPFKPYQLIIFPSVYAHRGLPSTTISRYILNSVLDIDTALNREILIKSSKLLKETYEQN